MERQVAEFEANPSLFLRKQAREDLAGVIFYFGAGIDGKPQYFEYRSNGFLHLKLQWIEWARLGERSVQTYHFSQKLHRWEQTDDRTYLHDRFPIPLPLERLVDQSRKPDDRVAPLSVKDEGKAANQALQTTPMTRSGSEKTIEFGRPQRGV